MDCYRDILILVKISANPDHIVRLKVYVPVRDHDEDEVGRIYDEISKMLHQEGTSQMNAIVMGDFKINVEEGSTNKVVGRYG